MLSDLLSDQSSYSYLSKLLSDFLSESLSDDQSSYSELSKLLSDFLSDQSSH